MNSETPIFVHASARSGSTYFYNVLRRNKSLMCFNEAIDDSKKDLPFRRTIRNGKPHSWNVNHSFLGEDDQQEFFEVWDEVMPSHPPNAEMQNYFGDLPDGLIPYLQALIDAARKRGRRPVICEVGSRGRAGALRKAFGGYHIAQYRNPISQFGSYVRALIEGPTWDFIMGPVVELNTCRDHHLVKFIPEVWMPPPLAWRTDTRSKFWASRMRYQAALGYGPVNHLFRWHLWAWFLGNLVALSYSDLALDIDKAHDDLDYRASIATALNVDLSDIKKFDRYYEFESFDFRFECRLMCAEIQRIRADIQAALPGAVNPEAIDLLLEKIGTSINTETETTRISRKDWKGITNKNRKVWHLPGVRHIAQTVHPLVFPILRTAGLR